MMNQKLRLLCENLYAKHGQHFVEDFVIDNYPNQEWGWCLGCDNEEPMDDGVCLICGWTISKEV